MGGPYELDRFRSRSEGVAALRMTAVADLERGNTRDAAPVFAMVLAEMFEFEHRGVKSTTVVEAVVHLGGTFCQSAWNEGSTMDFVAVTPSLGAALTSRLKRPTPAPMAVANEKIRNGVVS